MDPQDSSDLKPYKMKGVGFEVEEMMKLFLIIIIGLVVVIIIIGASGGIKQLLDEFCAKNPTICGQTSTQADRNLASASFNALVLAHNCVLDPSTCPCKKPNIASSCTINADNLQQTSGSSGGLFGTSASITSKIIGGGISGLQTIKSTTSKAVKVECTTQYVQEEDVSLQWGEELCKQKCESYGSRCKSWSYETYLTGEDIRIIDNRCVLQMEKEALDCTITNFNLPDNFKGISGNAKEYIEGFGDPNFLIYFQKFPEGEDSAWTGFAPWANTIATGMFFGMCASSFLGPVAKKIGSAAFNKIIKYDEFMNLAKGKGLELEAKSTMSYMLDSFKNSKYPRIFKSADEIPKNTEVMEAGYLYIETGQKGITSRINYAIKEGIKEKWKQEIIQKGWNKRGVEAAVRALGYTGVDAEAAYAASYIDSKVGKFIDESPKSLVLGTPLRKPQSQTLTNLESSESSSLISAIGIPKLGKPLVLDKADNLINNDVPLVLVSPCRADLTVKDDKILCETYYYDRLTGKTKCDNPKAKSTGSNAASCGDFTTIAGFQSNPVYFNTIDSILRNDRTMFEYEGNVLKNIIVPIPAEDIYFRIESTINCDNQLMLDCQKVSLYKGYSNPELIQADLSLVCVESYTLLSVNPQIAISVNKIFSSVNTGDSLFCYIDDIDVYNRFNSGISRIIWMKDKTSRKFYQSIIYPISTDDRATVLKDSNSDGKWDDFMYFTSLSLGQQKTNSFIIQDKNYDGTMDSIEVANCVVNGISTSVDVSNYKNSNEPNFCYGRQGWLGYGVTIASFAVDAAAKSIPSPYTWIGGAIANCGLGVLQLTINDNWPNGGVA